MFSLQKGFFLQMPPNYCNEHTRKLSQLQKQHSSRLKNLAEVVCDWTTSHVSSSLWHWQSQ